MPYFMIYYIILYYDILYFLSTRTAKFQDSNCDQGGHTLIRDE